MNRLFEMFCCPVSPGTVHHNDDDSPGEPRRFDSGLLAPSMLNNNNSNNRGHTVTISHYEDEEIIQNIFEVFAHVGDPSSARMEKLLCTALEQVKEPALRMHIISNLLESNRLHSNSSGSSGSGGGRNNSEQAIGHITHLVSSLDSKRREELATVIADLPAAVLGDAVAKEHSRVLIDLNTDVRESMKEDKQKISKKKKLVDTITEMMQQTLAQLSPSERDQAIIYIFSQQPQPLMLKTIMQQLFMSRLVSANQASREKLIQRLCGSSSSSSSSPSSSSSSTTTTTSPPAQSIL